MTRKALFLFLSLAAFVTLVYSNHFRNEARHRYAVLMIKAESTYLMSNTSLPISL